MDIKSKLHYTIIKYIIDKGFAPNIKLLAKKLTLNNDEIENGLYKLQEDHGIVLHPQSTNIWVIHPFSLAPTNFYVQSSRGEWWGNCAWCSLGIAALLKEDVKITTTFGAQTEKCIIHINNGEVIEKELLIHFPIPMTKAWKNVIYTCSNVLIFKNEPDVDKWAISHNIPKGDIQPIDKFWELSKEWYGNHLNPEWKKWTINEVKAIFSRYHLNHTIWNLEDSETRF